MKTKAEIEADYISHRENCTECDDDRIVLCAEGERLASALYLAEDKEKGQRA